MNDNLDEVRMNFEWDPNKAKSNLAKHGIDFIEGARMLKSGQIYEVSSSYELERRVLAIGRIGNRFVTVVYTKREENYRIISVRRARKKEKDAYEKARNRSV